MKAKFEALECNGELLTQLDVSVDSVRVFSGAKTFPKPTQQDIADALRYYAALMGNTRFKLEWSEQRSPNAKGIRYNHVIAESPLGLFSVEWKGWKDHPNYQLYLNGEWLQDGEATLEDTQQRALEYCLKLGAQLHSEPTGTLTIRNQTASEDTKRIDFIENHVVISGPGQDIRSAIDIARQLVEQGQAK